MKFKQDSSKELNMDFKFGVILFAIFFISVFMHGINGRNIIPIKTQQQKQAITTVKSIYGDTYDCVDLMKQPSLHDQPLVDYKEQKDILQGITRRKEEKKLVDGSEKNNIRFKEDCPNGTVPIPQKTKKHNNSNDFQVTSLNQSLDDFQGGYDVVGIVVEQDGLKGAFATISIHHPSGVTPGQASSARMRANCYNGYTEEFVEAGWTVDPNTYADDKTRLYTRWQSFNSSGCYNTNCPGFVLTNMEIPLDYAFPQISNPNTGEHHDVDIQISIGDVAGNWYLDVNGVEIGFWRGNLFQNLGNSATAIVFAGETYSRPPTDVSPPMGSGKFKGNNPEETAYMQNIQVLLDKFVPPPSYRKVERSRCYYASWEGYSGGGLNGFHFLFGGVGGHAGYECLS